MTRKKSGVQFADTINFTDDPELLRIALGFIRRIPGAASKAESLLGELAKVEQQNARLEARAIGEFEGLGARGSYQSYQRAREKKDRARERIRLLVSIIATYGNMRPNKDAGPTLELLMQVAASKKNGDPIMRLYSLEKLNDDQVRAAHEIARIFRSLTVHLNARIVDLGAKSEPHENDSVPHQTGLDRRNELILLHAGVYRPWASECVHANLVIDMAVHQMAAKRVRKKYRVGHDKVVSRLQEGLDTYNEKRKQWEASGGAANDNLPD